MPFPRSVTPDKGWAWAISIAAAYSNVMYGYVLVFGIFLIELTSEFDSSHAATAWTSGLMDTTCSCIAPLVAWLTTKYSFRSVVLTGTLLCVVGQVASFFVTELYQLFLTLGVIVGIGMGLIYASCIICLQQWFDKRLALANGIFAAGLGVGTFVLAPLTEALIEYYGWRGTMLILGGILGQMAWLGMLLRGKKITKADTKFTAIADTEEHSRNGRTIDEHRETSSISDSDDKKLHKQCDTSNKNNNNLTLHDSTDDFQIEKARAAYFKELGGSNHAFSPDSLDPISDKELTVYTKVAAKDNNELSNRCDCCCGVFNSKLLRNPEFLLYLFVFVCLYFSYIAPFVFIPDRAVELGIDKRSAALLVSIMAGCSTVARIIFGVIGDFVKKGRRLIFGLVILVGGIIQFVSLECKTFWSLALYCAIQGTSNGSIMVLNPVVLREMLGADAVADAISLQLFTWGVTALWCNSFVGWLYDVTGSYDIPFIVTGVVITVGGLLIIFLKPVATLITQACCCKRKQTFDLAKTVP